MIFFFWFTCATGFHVNGIFLKSASRPHFSCAFFQEKKEFPHDSTCIYFQKFPRIVHISLTLNFYFNLNVSIGELIVRNKTHTSIHLCILSTDTITWCLPHLKAMSIRFKHSTNVQTLFVNFFGFLGVFVYCTLELLSLD